MWEKGTKKCQRWAFSIDFCHENFFFPLLFCFASTKKAFEYLFTNPERWARFHLISLFTERVGNSSSRNCFHSIAKRFSLHLREIEFKALCTARRMFTTINHHFALAHNAFQAHKIIFSFLRAAERKKKNKRKMITDVPQCLQCSVNEWNWKNPSKACRISNCAVLTAQFRSHWPDERSIEECIFNFCLYLHFFHESLIFSTPHSKKTCPENIKATREMRKLACWCV